MRTSQGRAKKRRDLQSLAGVISPLVLLAVNVSIAGKLFLVEYTAYLESNEGTLIAIVRQVVRHPTELSWWRWWDCGLPFQNTYMPLLPLLAAGFSKVSNHSPALAFHQVTALFYCAGPVALYAMAWKMTHQSGPSFLAALAYSLVSPCAWFVPSILLDLGGAWNLRRLQNVAYYGEAPLTVAMALLPLAILFMYLALSRDRLWMKIAAGVTMGVTILANAFGAMIIGIASLCLVVSIRTRSFWRGVLTVTSIGLICYAWISPLIPPSVVAAIRANSPTVERDYRFNHQSFVGVCLLVAAFALGWWLTRYCPSEPIRFFFLFTLVTSGIVVLGAVLQMYVVPQPHRYQLAMDMGLALLGVFVAAELLKRFSPRLIKLMAVILILLLAFQFRHVLNYAHREIKSQDISQSPTYHAARWIEEHLPGERVMISGAHSFHFNDFSDVPQVFGGHETMLPNFVMRIAYFVIYRGEDFGDHGPDVSVLWLKAFGAHAILVPDQSDKVYYKPFVDPHKFDGALLPLWSEGGNTIYEIPSPTNSLAHVVPDQAVVRDTPVHGLDLAEIRKYVEALESSDLPEAPLIWINGHTALVKTELHPGQTLSLQITHTPGWHAEVKGHVQTVEKDGIGFIWVKPQCDGNCEIVLTYTGGREWRITSILSLLVMLTLVLFGLWRAIPLLAKTLYAR